MGSPELTGGAGFTYEDAVAAHYLVAMVAGTTATGLTSRVVQRVAQQQADFGEPLDDVIVDAVSVADGFVMRLSLQVKRSLTISDAATNLDFREVIQRSWQTLQKPTFREHVDRVGAATGTVTEEAFRNFTTVCELARASDSSTVFMQRFSDGGNASQAHGVVRDAVRKVAADGIGAPFSDDDLHRLFRHLTLIRFDFLHAGSSHEAEAIVSLQRSLISAHVGRAGDLWNQLRLLARDGAGRSAEHTRASVLRSLTGGLRFNGAPALAADIQVLREGTGLWLAQQADDIGGTHLDRQVLQDKLAAEMSAHRLTLIKGLPGTGKTVLLRGMVQQLAARGTTLLLTADRLSGRSWAEYARAIGLSNTALEPLLVEVAATGERVMFIDGLDRVAPEQRPILTDLLGQLLANPALAEWRVVATARDVGIEPLRNWVPASLLASGGVGYVDVDNLDDAEALALATTFPALRPLLVDGGERVQALARRPFFAAVLARGFAKAAYPAAFAPQSEVELVDAWWARGGYDAQAPQALARQRALIELARRSAPDLGRNLRIRDLSSATQAVLPVLEEDGLVQSVRQGHTAQFSHDIFFEWSFFHLLLDEGADWIGTLTAAGEPPALARVVELLSQATYADAKQWVKELAALRQARVRPQWLRAWLIAPVFSPRFSEQAAMYEVMLAADDHHLFGKLLVWMQAEKTTPNPLVLSGQLGNENLQLADRIRLADTFGWPSDFVAWRRLLRFLLDRIASVPDHCLPDVVALFETWQIAMADYANPVSKRIVTQCADWLHAVEDEHQSRRARYSAAGGETLPRQRVPTNLESELRGLVLRAARAYPDVVSPYLTKVEPIQRWSESGFRETMGYAPGLAQTHPALLAQVASRTFMAELPDEAVARQRKEEAEQRLWRKKLQAIPPEQRTRTDTLALESPTFIRSSFSEHDWDRLSIGAMHQGYFPASPLREPFHSLLAHDAAAGLALIRVITNHATTAWRQMYRIRHRDSTPSPLVLTFPWGRQEFWGADRHYAWFRGHGGPQVVECALMALERWGLQQLDAGRPVDDVLKELLEGHTSVAVLGIAVHLAIRSRWVSASTLALVGSQRLWRLDMQRVVEERQLGAAGLIGFDQGSADASHRQAVAQSAALESRRQELRDRIPFFVLGKDQAMRDACRAALEGFPDNLELAFQEDSTDTAHVASLRRNAELWSEFGRAENYKATPIAGRDDAVQISMSSARHEASDVQAALQRHAQFARDMELWLWVDKCFASWQWVPSFTPDEAVARATELAAALATGQGPSFMPGSGTTEGAIAGTAAAIICFSDATMHTAWANATIDTYRVQAEAPTNDTFSGSVIPWHPKLFVARALAARIKTAVDEPADRKELYRLVAHPLEGVSLTALAGIAGCWERDQRFAWCGLNLGLRLAQYTGRRDMHMLGEDARRQREQDHRDNALAEVLGEYRAGGALPPWVRPRPSWVLVPEGAPRRRHHEDDGGWEDSDDIWHSHYAAKVMRHVPVAAIMASAARDEYIGALEAFLSWTLDTLNPTWRADRRQGRERGDSNLYEWQDRLGRSLADAASRMPAAEALDRLLRPILEQPNEIAMRFLAPFTQLLVCADILDAPVIENNVVQLLHAVLERTLQHNDLRRSSHNDGRLGGFDLPELIKSLLFVSVERADQSARFANGRWDDLPQVMPLVDRMVREAGWNQHVAHHFVTLCERAGDRYPAETFADQVLAQLVDGSLPAGWKGTRIPAVIAALMQAHADHQHPLPKDLARKLLHVLDALVDLGDRRSAALQQSESFRGVRLVTHN